MTDLKLMKYIPKYYKTDVECIYKARREWNYTTKRWNQMITVIWKDGKTNTYQNATYMYNKLKYFGKE